jgi:hypothetical protein
MKIAQRPKGTTASLVAWCDTFHGAITLQNQVMISLAEAIGYCKNCQSIGWTLTLLQVPARKETCCPIAPFLSRFFPPSVAPAAQTCVRLPLSESRQHIYELRESEFTIACREFKKRGWLGPNLDVV